MAMIENMSKKYPEVNSDWTLFLDRDGVINRKLDGTYVMSPEQFEILPGVAEAIADASMTFGRIVVVTNQQGVGKELMTHLDLQSVHDKMLEIITWAGGRIDEIYYCPDLAWEDSPNRKPNPGMGYQARKDFPEIDFKKSIMVGDSVSDIAFGNTLKMITVRIAGQSDLLADFTHASLADFLLYLD